MTSFCFPEKGFCALLDLGLGLELVLGLGWRLRLEFAEIRLSTFLVKHPFGQVYYTFFL